MAWNVLIGFSNGDILEVIINLDPDKTYVHDMIISGWWIGVIILFAWLWIQLFNPV